MIRLLEETEIPLLEEFCEGNPFGCKIAGLQKAYGFSLPFARFWIQTNESGQVTAAVSLLDGAAVLHWVDAAESDELKEFLMAIGCRTLLCDQSAALALFGGYKQAGEILLSLSSRMPLAECQPAFLDEVPVRDVFSLLCDCGEQKPEQFEPFYLDVSHRVRHGVSLTQGVISQGRLIACALAGSITGTDAVLTAVAVHPEKQRMGLGSRMVQRLLSRLSHRNVYVLCENERAIRFYQSLSFESAGRWAELVIN